MRFFKKWVDQEIQEGEGKNTSMLASILAHFESVLMITTYQQFIDFMAVGKQILGKVSKSIPIFAGAWERFLSRGA